ncbi:phosphatidylinositol 5-phosphate 4-kinase type-2 alpha-like isoform X2 [Dendronephthya gigantea]|uniref:phosphatidylinositol 5-phosphate 4-kinase type-2 alpha-like isoform X2 n=1 Tax=Dendronephthya gigantea TaxID=151771 RepID=UPI00106BB64E|nr:phosphatidylinositol 5-phosphate 4-kinase type-2 alpha-like isoform X2 [Dendronephthya gigantea]
MASSVKDQNFKLKNKKFKAKSQKVKLFRSNEPLYSVFMWGVNHAINELSLIQVPPMFLPEDFKAYSKIRVDNHLFNREKFPSHFKFKEYCPLVFRKLREGFNIDDQAYADSFCVPPLRSLSSGRSGATFLASRNKKFIAKTLYKEEVEMMHQLLQKYYQFVVERNSNTLLPHYLGMYRVTVENKETYFVVMENIFGKLKIHKKYDLKGSTVDRQAKTKDKDKEKDKEKSRRKVEKSPTWKDQDFLADGRKIYLGEEMKKDFMEKLREDTDFLCKQKIMDYSLLVGIHDFDQVDEESDGDDGIDSQDESDLESPNDYDASGTNESAGDSPTSTPPGTPPATPPPTGLTPTSRPPLKSRTVSQDSNELLEAEDVLGNDFFALPCSEGAPKAEKYYLGIVDVLTYYGTKKRTAHAAKTVKHGHGQEISTVKPEAYAKRFLEFIEKAIE